MVVALRSIRGPEEDADEFGRYARVPSTADWLPLHQAARELNVSVTTVRRMIRKGQLRNRIVPRKGGFAYLVFLPDSRHADRTAHPRRDPPPRTPPLRLVPRTTVEAPGTTRDDEVRRLEAQVEHLSEALSRALRLKQKSLPEGIGRPGVNANDPYARYRWLARKRRFWPF